MAVKQKTLGNFGWLAYDGFAIFAPVVPGSGAFRAGSKMIKKARLAKASKVTFGHGARHLPKELNAASVENAILRDIQKNGATAEGFAKRDIRVGKYTVEYHMYRLKDGTVNVGTY